jgi:hypothetical protein
MGIEKANIHVIGVNQNNIYNLEQVNEQSILFITQPDLPIFQKIVEVQFLISSFIKGIESNIIFIPGESYNIIEFMISNDLINRFNIYSFYVNILPLDNDLLSLEKDDCFKEIYIDKNLTSISELASGFVKIESCFGKVKYKYIKGDNSKIFETLVNEKEKENDVKATDEILGMIVLDRSVDFLTTLTNNYTYEGLIDEFFGINLGSIKIKESFIKDIKVQNPEQEKTVTYPLSSSKNKFYSKIGCMYYVDVNNYLNKVTEYYKDIANKKNSSLEELSKQTKELKVFMTEIKDPLASNKKIFSYILNSIANEERILFTKMEQILLSGEFPPNLHLFYDDYICNKLDLNKILRLMAIESLTQGGIQDYNIIKRDILNIYGYQNIFLFRDLEELGWLKGKTYIKNLIEMSYSQLFEKLELINANPNPKKVENCSYILSGFCPISLRLIEKAVEGKWNKIQDIIKKMPGECSFPIDETEISKPTKDVNTIFVVFVGGVTYSEIEGIRFLNRKFKEAYDKNKNKKATRIQLIIVTTGILSTKKIFSSLGKKLRSTYTIKQFYEQVNKKQNGSGQNKLEKK